MLRKQAQQRTLLKQWKVAGYGLPGLSGKQETKRCEGSNPSPSAYKQAFDRCGSDGAVDSAETQLAHRVP